VPPSPSGWIASRIRSVYRGPEVYLTLIGAAIIVGIFLLALLAPYIAPYNPIKPVGDPLTPPNSKFIMGTDSIGRDVFSRIVYGSRIAIVIILLSAVFSLVVGVPLGLISGYVGGHVDKILTLVMDSIYAFPGLILAIAIAHVLGPGVVNIALSIAVIYIPTYFRMVRGEVLSVKENLYVEAARAIGAKHTTILFSYILPNVVPSIPIIFSLNAADAILVEAGLSFLGLGLPAPTPDWGFDLKNGHPYLPARCWWPVTFPGLMVVIVTLGFSLFGEGINEILNPRLKEG